MYAVKKEINMKNGSVRFRRWDSISDQSRPTSEWERESRKAGPFAFLLSFLPLSGSHPNFDENGKKPRGLLFSIDWSIHFASSPCHHLAKRWSLETDGPMAFHFCSMELSTSLNPSAFLSASIQYYYYYSNPFWPVKSRSIWQSCRMHHNLFISLQKIRFLDVSIWASSNMLLSSCRCIAAVWS